MLISENELEALIQEEIATAIEEGWLDRMIAGGAGLKGTLSGAASKLGAKAARSLGASTAAADMDKAAATRKQGATGAKKLALMKSHAQNFAILSQSMIQDAQKLGFVDDPNFKKALAASKAVATRLANIVAAWEKAPEQSPIADEIGSGAAAGVSPGDTVIYTNEKGAQKQAQVVKMLNTKDAQGDPQIQLKVGSAVFAVDQAKVKGLEDDTPTEIDLDAAVARRQAAGSPPIREILKNLIREELERIYG